MPERTKVYHKAMEFLSKHSYASSEANGELAWRAADAVAVGNEQILYQKGMSLFKPDTPDELEIWTIEEVEAMVKNTGFGEFVKKMIGKR